ncbi:MAG: hypothetical protein KF795_28990 [Labilithrix sp.]|nr:hypothetical protein [Labilithrix sp.]
MKAPRRLSLDEETSELARSLLAAGRARREPDGARERVWGALAVGVAGTVVTASAAGSGAGAASAAGAAGASASGGIAGGGSVKGAGVALALTKAKLLAIGGVVTVATSLAVVSIEQTKPPTTAESAPAIAASATALPERREARASAQTAEPESTAEPNIEEPARVDSAIATPKPNVLPTQVVGKARVKDEATPSVGRLREEAALLHAIRAALVRGDVADARTKLDEARARFPKSQLAPERDALEVRLASESGDHERAAILARKFVEHYPDSPLRAGMESIPRAPEKE